MERCVHTWNSVVLRCGTKKTKSRARTPDVPIRGRYWNCDARVGEHTKGSRGRDRVRAGEFLRRVAEETPTRTPSTVPRNLFCFSYIPFGFKILNSRELCNTYWALKHQHSSSRGNSRNSNSRDNNRKRGQQLFGETGTCRCRSSRGSSNVTAGQERHWRATNDGYSRGYRALPRTRDASRLLCRNIPPRFGQRYA